MARHDDNQAIHLGLMVLFAGAFAFVIEKPLMNAYKAFGGRIIQLAKLALVNCDILFGVSKNRLFPPSNSGRQGSERGSKAL